MKWYIIFSLLFVLSLAGCRNTADEVNADEPVVIGSQSGPVWIVTKD